MTNATQSIVKRDESFSTVAVVLSIVITAVLLLVLDINPFAAAGVGLLFFASSIFFLSGNLFRRAICCFFLIQYVALNIMPIFPPVITGACLLFLPLAFGKVARLSALGNIPYAKSLLLMLLGFAISIIYSCIASVGTFEYLIQYDIFFLLGIAVMYTVYYLLKHKLLNMSELISYIAISGVVVICFVIARYATVSGIGLIFSERFGTSIDINPNLLASYFDLTLPCAFFMAFFEKKSVAKKIFFYALALIYVCVIFAAATRGSLPGIAIIALYVVWKKRSMAVLLGMLVCMIAVASTIGTSIIGRILAPTTTSSLMSDIGRIEFLRSALRILQDNYYFFGVGMNNFSVMKYDYGSPAWTNPWASSHNFFAEIWLGWGLLALIGWLTLNATVTIRLFRKYKDSAAANAVVFAIVAFSIHGLVDSVLAHYSIMFVYFSLLAVGLFLLNGSKNHRTELDQT